MDPKASVLPTTPQPQLPPTFRRKQYKTLDRSQFEWRLGVHFILVESGSSPNQATRDGLATTSGSESSPISRKATYAIIRHVTAGYDMLVELQATVNDDAKDLDIREMTAVKSSTRRRRRPFVNCIASYFFGLIDGYSCGIAPCNDTALKATTSADKRYQDV